MYRQGDRACTWERTDQDLDNTCRDEECVPTHLEKYIILGIIERGCGVRNNKVIDQRMRENGRKQDIMLRFIQNMKGPQQGDTHSVRVCWGRHKVSRAVRLQTSKEVRLDVEAGDVD